MKNIGMIFCLFILLVTGCSPLGTVVGLKGESESWKVEGKITLYDKNLEPEGIVLTYQKEERPIKIKDVEVSFPDESNLNKKVHYDDGMELKDKNYTVHLESGTLNKTYSQDELGMLLDKGYVKIAWLTPDQKELQETIMFKK
ncbi:hypothetical protein [Aneurinibacillus tyrosinisolvens]|uniref:hypothetical protein n=1 Tax=Aneurinibacillus tyrosinisolvens TaxID=1443435 RepID=UPI00063F3E99|nr:hypothetical protein [Aneurinibacillus tyrosinisolvens]